MKCNGQIEYIDKATEIFYFLASIKSLRKKKPAKGSHGVARIMVLCGLTV